MIKHTHILFDRLSGKQGEIGLITLNRPEALNALSHEMICSLDHQLSLWQQDPLIITVVIRSSSKKAFCAGGDIRQLHQRSYQQNGAINDFFWDEYRLNRRIFHYPKPYIALLDGITMGGGVGISLHGSHPVASENLIFSMPETSIGFFPDVGASYLLSRCPGKLGIYLALIGTRLHLIDSYYCGIIKYHVTSDRHEALLSTLLNTSFSEPPNRIVDGIINSFKQDPPQNSTLKDHREIIDRCFSQNTLEKIQSALLNTPHAWALKVANLLTEISPTSLKITLRLIQQARKLNFDDCLRMEYRLVNRVIMKHDFYEGIRALLIDKNNQPNWQPKTLIDIPESQVDTYFAPLPNQELQFNEE